ncbi:MAG: hypothetical protein SF123_10570 [Chloroflexota bacterium]|nr:hypothetical protein [Chloroflexota bacterium]
MMPKVVEMDADEFMKLWNTFKSAPPDSLTLIACLVIDGAMKVERIERLRDLFDYPDETLVVAQRRTGTNTAFAEFTVGKLRAQQVSSSA